MADEKPVRKDGYYWVKVGWEKSPDQWDIGYWKNAIDPFYSEWHLIDDDRFTDDDLKEIGEQLNHI